MEHSNTVWNTIFKTITASLAINKGKGGIISFKESTTFDHPARAQILLKNKEKGEGVSGEESRGAQCHSCRQNSPEEAIRGKGIAL